MASEFDNWRLVLILEVGGNETFFSILVSQKTVTKGIAKSYSLLLLFFFASPSPNFFLFSYGAGPFSNPDSSLLTLQIKSVLGTHL